MIVKCLLSIVFACLVAPVLGDEPLAEKVSPLREISSMLRDQWSGRVGVEGCGLQCEASWHHQLSGLPSVILVPGLMASPGSMALIRRELQRASVPVAVYQYSSRMSIEAAGVELRNELSRLAAKQPDRELVLVTHSLGGLIARVAIESGAASVPAQGGVQGKAEQGRAGEREAGELAVKRLIMIAPPNHGSALAELSAKELTLALAGEAAADDSMALVDEAVSGFLGAAQADLRPGSPLLRELNGRPRAAGVEYCIIAGTKAPLQAEVVDLTLALAGLLLGDAIETMPLLQSAQRLGRVDEWTSGKGDGVVSVESTKLAGVNDLVRLPFAHNEFGEPDTDGSQHVGDASQGAMAAVKRVVERVTAPKP